jgi:hypothetical protein
VGTWIVVAAVLGGCPDGGPTRHADSDLDADTDTNPGPDGGVGDGGCPADAGPDGDSDVDDICACLRATEVRACRPAPSVSCVAPEDCCDAGSPIPCGYFGNRFACAGGLCEPEGCSSHSECRTWAESTGRTDADAYGCLDPICGVGTPYCGLGTRDCETAGDCCLTESPIPCGTYGNRWNCGNNRCSTGPCECDADCAEYARAAGEPDPDAWACVQPLCHDFGTCAPRRPCALDADCCEAASAVPCGTFGNRWACHRGQCFAAGCESDEECVSYATSSGLPGAASYECP